MADTSRRRPSADRHDPRSPASYQQGKALPDEAALARAALIDDARNRLGGAAEGAFQGVDSRLRMGERHEVLTLLPHAARI